MKEKCSYSVSYIKNLGKEKSSSNLSLLMEIYRENMPIDIKREVVSSIGRQNDDRVYFFILNEAFSEGIPMELIYQMYRTCLYKEGDNKFFELGEKIRTHFKNEVIEKMRRYHNNKKNRRKRKIIAIKPTIMVGDTEQTLKTLEDGCVQLMFTSPPYYNAREYCNYNSYDDYLQKMKKVFAQCNRVLEDGRFLIVNVSPVITKRPGREFESIRYPIHYDYHKILEEVGFYFVDEIIWIKPEPCVPNRNGGYMQTRKPLSYKPNCITESLMVYRKNCDYLLDKNINDYGAYEKYLNEDIDTSNCWYISPKSSKDHPAVFPEELCRRVLKYYSFEKDIVLDPFAGSGTLGKVARVMNRIPIMCEMNEQYIKYMQQDQEGYYDVRRRCDS